MQDTPRTDGWRQGAGALEALALANARFWATVAPHAARELRAWRAPAEQISDAELRTLALRKQRDEHFNAQVAATLATLAPQGRRQQVAQAIVALELLFDYLDGRTELRYRDPLAEGKRLSIPFTSALQLEHNRDAAEADADGEYMLALARRTRTLARELPAIEQVAPVALTALQRCAEAQVRIHAAASLGDRQLADWAQAQAPGSGLGWREYAAGCASSVLSAHALLAAAADTAATVEQARRIDAAYLAIAALITMLDSLVDHPRDLRAGRPGFIRLFETREDLASSMRGLVAEALGRCREAPHSEHHVMTLAGVVAYWTSDPGAHEEHARAIVAELRRELSPTIWPALAVMGAWRAAKRTRSRAGKHKRSRPRVDREQSGP